MTAVITSIPSPYQVELFDAVARRQPAFHAIYLSRRDRSRSWLDAPLRHEAMFLDEVEDADKRLSRWMTTDDLVVFADYSSRMVRDAMRHRAAAGKPWCFWGERPGFRGGGWLGRMWRHVHLAPLHGDAGVPIWGIGRWAVGEYEREFGGGRLYCNVPYFSDLERFRAAAAHRQPAPDVHVLYSGALIRRKGVDLLAKAFSRLGQTHLNVRLSVVGDGPLLPLMKRELAPLGARAMFHGFVPWSELPKFYASADVLCAPSRYDGWGLIVPEAMAAGMPVIATDRMGAALELIEPGTNGWRVRAGSLRHLYDALSEATGLSPERHAAMGRAGQSRALQQDVQVGAGRFHDAVAATLRAWHDSHDGAPLGVAAQ